MQQFERTYQYIHEYQQLLYDFYSKTHVSYIVTYYNLDTTSTVWEDINILGGSYEKIGSLSGIKWNKYLLLPIYFPEEISTALEANEIGLIKENDSHIVLPTSYNITPYTRDIVKLEQSFLRPTNDIYPIFSVTGIEKTTNTDKYFYRLKIEVEQSRTITDIDQQVNNTYIFFEYTKKIYTLQDATFLTKLMSKNQEIRSRLTELYDFNSGFYLI